MSLLNPTAFNGQGGNVTFGASGPAGVRDWKLEISADAINVTSTADGGWKSCIVAPKGGTGTFKVSADSSALQTSLIKAGDGASTISLQLGSLGLGRAISMSAFITKAALSNPAEEDVNIEYSFQSTGTITFTS